MAKIRELFWQGVTVLFGVLIPIGLMVVGPRLLGWSEGRTLFTGLGYWVVLIGFILWWLSRDEKILGEEEDPILGMVTRKRSGWQAHLNISSTESEEYEDSILISGGDTAAPTVIQLATFVEIKDGWDRWVELLNQALDGHSEKAVSAQLREIFYDKIEISANELAWSLSFSIERDRDDLDLVANFRNGELTEVQLLPLV